MILLDAHQSLLGVVAKALHGVAADAFFAQSPKPVIAIAFVLEYMHAVVFDVAASPSALQQVGGGVVVVALAVQFRVIRGAVAVVAQALGGVVNVVFVTLDTFAVALAEEAPELAVVRQRLAGIATATALGLGQTLDDQIVAGIVLVAFIQQRQFFTGSTAVVQGFLAEASAAVVAGSGQQAALGAQHFIVQLIALEVADHPAVEVELMQVATAVVQVVELTLVGQGQGFKIAQGVVVITQFACVAAFAEQLTEGVIAEFQLLWLTVARGKNDRQQIVSSIVGIVGNPIVSGFTQQLAALRVYRMLEERQNRRPAIVEEWVAKQWQRAYPGQGQLQADLMGHLGYALKYADADLPHYRERITQVQQQLRQLPMAERVYMSLKQDALERLHRPLDLRNEVGPAFDIVYRPLDTDQEGSGLLLAPLLTAKGFKDYFEPGTEGIIELAMIDQWVLGERQRLDYSDEDRKVLTQRIRALYSADYVDSWRRALNQFAVTDFDDLSHGVAVLEQVTGPAAPLRRLLETLRDNSVIYPSVPLAEGQAPLTLDRVSDGQQQAAGIRRAFSSLAELISARGEQPSYYEETLRSVSAVYDYAKAVHDNPDPGKAALKTVLNRFSLGGADPIANLQRVAVGLPEPLNQQVKKLADQTSQVLVIAALRELEKRWDSEIYSFYRDRLAGRYPFKASGEDASLEDFEAFFGPQGRLQHFHDQYLSVFLKDNLDALYSDSLGGYLVRTDVLEQLKNVERIRDTFFNHRGHLAVQLTIQPLALSTTRLSSMLSVDGQLIPYQHGAPQRTGLVWPNSLSNTNGSQLTLVHSTGNTASLSYRGPWSLFRLLSRGHLNGRTDTSVDLTFSVADGLMRYRIGAEKANNPITQRSFEGFVLPRTLLEERRSNKSMNNVERVAATAFGDERE